MRKRPRNLSEEYAEIKRVYPNIDKILKSDPNLSAINCSDTTRHKLQKEYNLNLKSDDKVYKVRLFMIKYLKFEYKKHYDVIHSYCGNDESSFKLWVIKAHVIAFD